MTHKVHLFLWPMTDLNCKRRLTQAAIILIKHVKRYYMVKYMLLVTEDEYEHLFFQNAIDSLNHKFRLLSAYSGKSGLRIFRKVKPVSVFINFKLNDMNGLL